MSKKSSEYTPQQLARAEANRKAALERYNKKSSTPSQKQPSILSFFTPRKDESRDISTPSHLLSQLNLNEKVESTANDKSFEMMCDNPSFQSPPEIEMKGNGTSTVDLTPEFKGKRLLDALKAENVLSKHNDDDEAYSPDSEEWRTPPYKRNRTSSAKKKTIESSDDEFKEIGNSLMEDIFGEDSALTPPPATLVDDVEITANNFKSNINKFRSSQPAFSFDYKTQSLDKQQEEVRASTQNSKKTAAVEKQENRFSFLVNIRDAEGRYPNDPEYDPKTIFIPKSAWAVFTPFERQFWEIKCKLYDTVVFFKKGKFYELYEQDADIGHQQFDLKLTDRVNMRMVGVPEVSFDYWASKFIAKGYKVGKVDQMETAIGKSLREKDTKAKEEKIIRRELTSVLTSGTLVDGKLINTDSAVYCLSVKEEKYYTESSEGVKFGIAFVDTATAKFFLCSLNDTDSDFSQLDTLMAQIKPKEIVYEKGNLSKKAIKVIKNLCHSSLWNPLRPNDEFWGSDATRSALRTYQYFGSVEKSDFPSVLLQCYNDDIVISALGGLIYYLKTLKLDQDLLSLKNFYYYDPIQKNESLVMDGQTLANLEIFNNVVDDSEQGTLIQLLDYCVTPFGKRLFRLWVCHPLRDVEKIKERLDAIDAFDFMLTELEQLQRELKKLPDLERIITRIHAGKCKLKDLLNVLEGYKTMKQAITAFGQFLDLSSSKLLEKLFNGFPDYSDQLSYFESAFEYDTLKNDGVVIPQKGVEKDFDDINERIEILSSKFQDYLEDQKKELRCRTLEYKNIGKELFQLEVPKNVKVPGNFMRLSQTKTSNRYWSPYLRNLAKEWDELQEIKNSVMRELQGRLFQHFDQHFNLWQMATRVVAEIDCLISLSLCKRTLGEPYCRPQFRESDIPILEIKQLRHPCLLKTMDKSFIPNDVKLGGDSGRMVLLTGPNMGGKSTLLRQTCIAVVMAQLGSYIPAESVVLTTFDRIFTRIGANDNILVGQSTFMVELSETSRILKEATEKSIVILDELGRGTSTFDGYAIAYSVLHHLATHTRCLGMFSTHYIMLTDEFSQHPEVLLMHMASKIDPNNNRDVMFLYKLVPGVSPKSYGMHVAAMAGISNSLIERAHEIATKFETSSLNFQAVQQKRTGSASFSLLEMADTIDMLKAIQLGDDEKVKKIANIWLRQKQ